MVCLLTALVLVGCNDEQRLTSLPPVVAPASTTAAPSSGTSIALLPDGRNEAPKVAPLVVHGTGRFVASSPDSTAIVGPSSIGEPVTLDFVNVDVRDVVRSVLGDVLRLPYTIDPAVQGTITLQTGQPLARGAVLSALETALRTSNIAIVEGQGFYKIVPLANAGREARLGAQGMGFVAQVVTPRYVAAADLQRVLEPMLPSGTTLRADPGRNVLIVSGPAQDVATLLNNMAVFDVDAMRGMSLALLPLKSAPADGVAKEVGKLLDATGSGSLVRIIPIERLNAVLVTALQPVLLDRARAWIQRFDTGAGSSGQQLFVYRVQNGRAADIAGVLRKALGIAGETAGQPQGAASATADSGGVGEAGGLPGGGIGGGTPANSGFDTPSPTGGGGANPLLGGLSGAGAGNGQPGAGIAQTQGGTASPSAGTSTVTGTAGLDLRITADETNNALLIMATQQQYATIEAALRQLDIQPLQVLIEATVAEVTLTNRLAYGLQYYVRSGNFQAQFASGATGGSGSTTVPDFAFAPGINLALTSASDSSVVLQLLQQLTEVRVLSSPNLLVLNNQAARIQVGDQVPIATGSAVSTLTPDAPIVNSIEYRDTGVILKVTPRVNASGMVSIDVSEEVSSVGTTTSSSLNSPTISERRLNSTVAIGDGQTIALGGLISDSRTRSRNGIPWLQDIPGLGWLFGTRSNSGTRSELIVLLTPHVVRDPAAARAVTQELQAKLPLTVPLTRPPS